MRRHGRVSPELRERDERRRQRSLLRRILIGAAVVILGTPFAAACLGALVALRRGW